MAQNNKVRFMSLSSGSNGNCYWLEAGDGGILIDAGVSIRQLRTAFQTYGIPLDSIKGILVTHDHSDHIRNLGSFCKKLRKPVWMTATLSKSAPVGWMTGAYLSPVLKLLPERGPAEIIPGSISATPFTVPHDATQTVGYAIEAAGERIVIMTDIGAMTAEALEYAAKASTVIIEANYDLEMLLGGPYPKILQDRIRGGHGHLSNAECAEAVGSFLHEGLRNVFLCHLSAHNNTPEKAVEAVRTVLEGSGARLAALPRTDASPMFEL